MRDVHCPHCTASFADENARYQHAKAKHGKKAARELRPAREQSLGEGLAEAVIAFKCGEEPDPYFVMVFPDAFK
jgi:hypothetical protein